MTLTIEDGSIVANANSYATGAEIRAYALARGVTLAAEGAEGDALVEVMAISAMDYLDALEGRYRGTRVSPGTQTLAWPRMNAYVYGSLYSSETIPTQLVQVQAALAIQIKNGVALLPTASGDFIKREKIGPLETEYSELVKLSASRLPVMPAIDALLAPLLNNVGPLTTRRL